MTERDLTSLKNLPVPPVRDAAKRAARAAALEAFDKVAENSSEASKGEAGKIRPNPQSHQATRRKFMTFTRSQYAMAASFAALMIAAPLAFQNSQRTGLDNGQIGVRDETMSGKPATFDLLKDAKKNERGVVDSIPGEAIREGDASGAGTKATEPAPVSTTDKETSAAATETAEASAQPPPAPPVALQEAAKPAFKVPSAPMAGLGGTDGTFAGFQTSQRLANAPTSLDGRLSQSEAYSPSVHLQDADRLRALTEQEFRDKFDASKINPVKQVAAEPVSTFSIDVDTASYSFVRRALNAGQLPPKDSVRVEEMINYFPYDYPRPETAETPFQPTVTVMPSPWNPANQLVHVAIKGYDLKSAERPRANLVLLMDISGSMDSPDKLPLVKNAFRMLADELQPDDTVAIVTYASGSGILLEPTKISDKRKIAAAIDGLGAGGSTAGADGIQDAYRLAEANFDKNAVNRVILATDGDFNVGVTDHDDLKGLIERKREKGIFLSILGVGQGNYNDSLMQTLAQNGNGTAAYVDTLNEARKVLVDEASSTLFTIAKDVKIQIEWNPARVSEYRLIGYETRALAREDFNNDKVDAGDIGSGHTVTAIYEVTPAGAELKLADDLRYAKPDTAPREAAAGSQSTEIGFLKLRYKLPKEDTSKLITLPITDEIMKESGQLAKDEARFSVAVAAFGQLLKGAPYVKSFGYDGVIELARPARGADPYGYRAEFLNLVRLAKSARE